jgi:hypothetical protein
VHDANECDAEFVGKIDERTEHRANIGSAEAVDFAGA